MRKSGQVRSYHTGRYLTGSTNAQAAQHCTALHCSTTDSRFRSWAACSCICQISPMSSRKRQVSERASSAAAAAAASPRGDIEFHAERRYRGALLRPLLNAAKIVGRKICGTSELQSTEKIECHVPCAMLCLVSSMDNRNGPIVPSSPVQSSVQRPDSRLQTRPLAVRMRCQP